MRRLPYFDEIVMKKIHSTVLLFVGLMLLGFTNKNNKTDVRDYLNVPGPLTLDSIYYNLAWSSHPSDNYYIQEYIPKSDSIERFNKMILINVLVSNSIKVDEVVAAKIAEIIKMQKTNPVIQYKEYANEKTGEYMIDFLLSENESDGNHLKLVERNVYRYKQVQDKSGQKGILLVGTSTRSYGHDIYNFFAELKEHREDMITKVGDFPIPEITLLKDH
jgi:hypothetical protein